MAIINTIRAHSGLIVGLIIGGLILSLVGGDIMRIGPALSGKRHANVGEVAGQKVSIKTYQEEIEYLQQLLLTQNSPKEDFAEVTEGAWQRLIIQVAFQKEYDALGLTVSKDELVDMVQGEHISPAIKAAFVDPETQKFDKKVLIKHLKSLARLPEARQAQWHEFENKLADMRKQEKFFQLMQQTAFFNDLEAKAKHEIANTSLHIKCLYVPYHTCPDDDAAVTDVTLKNYLDAHKSAYQIEEIRSVKYLNFPINPSREDEEVFTKELQVLKEAFAQSKDDQTFAKTNTDGVRSLSYFSTTAEQLPSALLKQKATLTKGLVIGPVREGNLYKLYKVAAFDPKAAKPYEIAIVERRLVPSEQARDGVSRKADHCASIAKDITQLEAYAEKEGISIYNAQAKKNDVHLGRLANARELVRWLYNEAVIGKVSPVFELENSYAIAVMTKQVPKGTAPLEQVRDEIALKVKNERKSEIILAQLQALTAKTLEEKAAQYGQGAQIMEVEDLHFYQDTLKRVGMARKAIGAAFALQQGQQTTVADENGVLIVELIAKNAKEPIGGVETYKQSLAQLEKIKQFYYVLEGVQELAQVKDYRYKFY